MDAVVGLLKELDSMNPRPDRLNKQDRVAPQLRRTLCLLYYSICYRGRNPDHLAPLIARMRSILWEQFPMPRRYPPKQRGAGR